MQGYFFCKDFAKNVSISFASAFNTLPSLEGAEELES